MNEKQMILIGVLVVIFIAFLVVVNLLDNKSLNGIKAKKVGNGQHGTARWATKAEIKRTFIPLPFEPEMWRKGQNLPTVQGTVVGCRTHGKKTVAIVDDGDVHTLMIGAAGVGKTAIAEGLAKRIVDNQVPDLLANSVVYSLDLGALLTGTKYRGDFEKRFKAQIGRASCRERVSSPV